jgi:hypothetical protein
MVQNSLGSALLERNSGDEDLRRAIEHCEAALEIHGRDTAPQHWAIAHYNLACAWKKLAGNRMENLSKTLAHIENSLEYYSREEYPVEWAQSLVIRAAALRDLPDQAEHSDPDSTIRFLESALEVLNVDQYPDDRALALYELGLTWLFLGEKQLEIENTDPELNRAFDCLTACLKLWSPDSAPLEYKQANMALSRVLNLRKND